MEQYPKTLAELERQFATEEACAQYLFQLRWPDGFSCPRCGAEGKALVLIAAQKHGKCIGRIRLRRVRDASAGSLQPAIAEAVEPGSVVRTDGWNGYSGLDQRGYIHQIARKQADVGENLLPSCNRVASLLKRWLLGTHQGAVSHKYLDYYLDEYTFRFNRRTSLYRGKLFYRLVQQAAATEAVPYSALVKNVRGPKPKEHNI